MDIFDIISRSLMHDLEAGEQRQLDQWLAESEEHQRLYQSLLAKEDLAGQYRTYRNLDGEKAWRKLAPLIRQTEDNASRSRHRFFHIPRRYVGRVAAAIVGVLLVAGGSCRRSIFHRGKGCAPSFYRAYGQGRHQGIWHRV